VSTVRGEPLAGLRPTSPTRTTHTLAQWFCRLVGLVLVVIGIAGFFVNGSFDTGAGVPGDDLLGFEVNGWHNLVHLGTGLLLMLAAPSAGAAKAITLTFGLTYAAVAVIGLIDGDDVVTLVSLNDADNVLHVVLAALALLVGLASRGARRA
jgi:Domain of unknown function (DUF4383)